MNISNVGEEDVVVNEHEELVAELPQLEKLSAEARLQAAKQRRNSQLKRYLISCQNEELFPPSRKKKRQIRLKFEESITLIEAAARNDAEEGQLLCYCYRPLFSDLIN